MITSCGCPNKYEIEYIQMYVTGIYPFQFYRNNSMCVLRMCSVLASIIWVALYGMFKPTRDVWRYFKLSVWDMVSGRRVVVLVLGGAGVCVYM